MDPATRRSTRKRAALICAATALLIPAYASASTKVYGGTAASGGKVEMDVKLSKQGVPKRITELRAVSIPGTCEISGPDIPLHATLPVKIDVSAKGKFEFEVTDAQGNKSTLEGKFNKSGTKASGTFVYASHFEAEGPWPEEDCTTGETGFTVKKGGPNAIEPPPQAPARLG